MNEIPKDPRPAHTFARYHRAARRHPYLQALAFVIIVPVLLLASRVRVHGRENIPEGGFIAAPNHPSYVDPLFVAIALRGRRLSAMGKSNLFKGWKGRLFTRIGGFPVRRGHWDTDAFATAEHVLRDGRVMLMFPEGTIVAPGERRPAKPGIGHIASLTGTPIVPIHLDGPRAFFYRPWTWQKVTITIGEALPTEQDVNPSRETCQDIADRAVEAIYALGR